MRDCERPAPKSQYFWALASPVFDYHRRQFGSFGFLEAFNVTNFVSRQAPGSNIRLATFGIYTAAAAARQAQWGARFSF